LVLFEYDRRFQSRQGYEFYDYRQPLNIAAELQHRFSVIVCDPPFLSEECQEKVCESIALLSAGSKTARILYCTGGWDSFLISIRILYTARMSHSRFGCDIIHDKPISCTHIAHVMRCILGAVMRAFLHDRLQLQLTTLRPKHANRLSNEFCCLANFESSPELAWASQDSLSD
jgi:hypothetical protein